MHMVEDLYTQALSLFNQGEYEKALRIIERSALNTLREKELLEQCKKQILAQYCYLINESIRQKDYQAAKSIKDEYRIKFGVSDKIDAIKIPEMRSILPTEENQEETRTDSRKYLITLGVIVAVIVMAFVLWKSNSQEELSDIKHNEYTSPDSIKQLNDNALVPERSNTESNLSPVHLECEGDMIGYPIQMNINIDNDNRISGTYLNVKYDVSFVLEGMRSENGVLHITAHHSDAVFYFTLKPIDGNKLIGYGSNGKNKLDIHLNVKASDAFAGSLKRYYNSRFGYGILYPSSFNIIKEPENGDGCKFSKDDNTYLSVSGIYNSLDETLEDVYNRYKSKSPAYCRIKDNWFVVSDNTDDGYIFYQKTVLKDGIFMTAILHYPSSENDYYSTLIPKIFTDFPD